MAVAEEQRRKHPQRHLNGGRFFTLDTSDLLLLQTVQLVLRERGVEDDISDELAMLGAELTTGSNLDANGYSVQVTGPSLNVEQTIGLNDQIIFTVTPGSYSSRLIDIADNCTVDVNPFNVIVTAGATSQVTFRVNCV